MRERDIHAAVYDFLVAALPPESIVRTIPGGDGARTMAPRYRSGTSDIVAVTPKSYGRRPLFVEVKGPRGRMSDDQRDEAAFCAVAEIDYVVVSSVEQMHQALLARGFPCRARLAA